MTEDGRTQLDGEDSIERLAADLRALRLEADSPTLERLRSETGISRTVLSEAFAGRTLPTARTVDRIARACCADPAVWVQRRDALAAARARRQEDAAVIEVSTADSPTVDAFEETATVVAAPDRPAATISRRLAVGLAAGSFLAGAAATALALTLLVPALLAATGPRIAVENGLDPGRTPCVDDARVATGESRADDSLLEIVWSDACQAGWGRITRYDGLAQGNTVSIAIFPETAPDGPDRQEATEHDVQGAYTTLVVRPSPDTLLCAAGSFTVDGVRVDLGDPICI